MYQILKSSFGFYYRTWTNFCIIFCVCSEFVYFSPQGRGVGARQWPCLVSQWFPLPSFGGTPALPSCITRCPPRPRPPAPGTRSPGPTCTSEASLPTRQTRIWSCSVRSKFYLLAYSILPDLLNYKSSINVQFIIQLTSIYIYTDCS